MKRLVKIRSSAPRQGASAAPRAPARPRRGARAAWGIGLSTLLGACSFFVDRGSDLYFQGRYIEAAHVLEKTENRLPTGSPEERAAYGLYRGATLLRLGDLRGAERWLDFSRRTEIEFPGSLSRRERQLLRETLIALRVDIEREQAGGL